MDVALHEDSPRKWDDGIGPWQLGHICRRWRAAALAYVPLWTTFCLYTPWMKKMDGACPPAMVTTQLNRSGIGPLDVTVLLDEYGHGITSESLRLLCNCSDRWKKLRIRSPAKLDRIQSLKGHFSLLHRLELVSASKQYPHGDVFSIAPSLREVLFTGETYSEVSISFSSLVLPWSQITRFRGTYYSETLGFQILQVAPALPDLTQPLVVPHLRRLSIRASARFMPLVTAPALQELWISHNAAVSLLDCIQRSRCSLVKLVVYTCTNPDVLIPILAAVPTLTTFFVLFERTTERAADSECRLLHALTVSNDSPALIPSLSRLAMGDLNTLAFGALLDVADSRRSPPLSFLRAFYTGPLMFGSLDVLPRVEKMKAAGLDVAFEAEFTPGLQNYMSSGAP
ncbi:hypothetical protein B0H16DRAFT_1715539 [Mycena metata]|uniref:F-box domain-containing protein n=1 Tax=Mycena metata TaxID=1033252 RepID=A0AAD7NPN9_9AGAR|nr:hypothetical protein B0H16DRAFT_1715539 [Mycena metata]